MAVMRVRSATRRTGVRAHATAQAASRRSMMAVVVGGGLALVQQKNDAFAAYQLKSKPPASVDDFAPGGVAAKKKADKQYKEYDELLKTAKKGGKETSVPKKEVVKAKKYDVKELKAKEAKPKAAATKAPAKKAPATKAPAKKAPAKKPASTGYKQKSKTPKALKKKKTSSGKKKTGDFNIGAVFALVGAGALALTQQDKKEGSPKKKAEAKAAPAAEAPPAETPAPEAGEGDKPENVAEAKEWIDNWKEKQS